MTIRDDWQDNHPLLRDVIKILRTQGIEAYLVGGAVRDLLLGRSNIVDLDFAVPGDGLTVARQVANALNVAFYPLDQTRGTGRVVYDTGHQKNHIDFASFRGPTLQADLAGRDFTINAIALDIADPSQLIDPLQGRQDLESGQIRATSAAVFNHDPVRILRAIRQAVDFRFSIEIGTVAYLQQAAPMLATISPERQRDELLKLLNTPEPGQAVRMLHQFGVLAHILPEVDQMVGVNQSPPHYLDVFEHTIAALDAWVDIVRTGWSDISIKFQTNIEQYFDKSLAGELTQQMLIPLALLLHDTGKPLTYTTTTSDHTKIHFLGHEQESAKISREVMNRLHFSGQATGFVAKIVAHHMRPLWLTRNSRVVSGGVGVPFESTGQPKISRRAIYRLFRATNGEAYHAGVAVAIHALADHRATYPPNQGIIEEQILLTVVNQLITAYFEQYTQLIDPPLLLTGRDLIKELDLSEGRLIGRILNRLKEAQAIGQVQDRATALAFVKADPDFIRYQQNIN